MQAAMQTNHLSFSLQANANSHTHGGAQPPLPRASAFDAHRPSPQMSNMQGGFSKTSFSMASHTSPNGSSSTYTSQSTTVSRGYGSNQTQARCDRRDDSFGGRGSATTNSRFERNSNQCDRTPPRNDHGSGSGSDAASWNVTSATNDHVTLQDNGHTIDVNQKDQSVTVTNNKTGAKTVAEGDPHFKQNGTSAMFTKPVELNLDDGTKVILNTQADKNNPKVSYVSQLDVVNKNQALQIGGINNRDGTPLSVQHNSNGRQIAAAAQGAYQLVEARNGKGFNDPTTGKNPTQSDFNQHAA
ncbi:MULTISPECIES: DUF1521 domain-containing protein [Paraburkholderia]|uniref:DUF1521 domain-containing protein n=1 Tax=Paraburkholderia dioscoreae TaxID=2604047 RepID=A0A5Q4ZC16_9BURK|nr:MULTISPECIES: DUF1521 domain-containing protein [Paraburkholderia]MDR8402053.1 DUF1521 domain-containing protein [Paraburkholderia sp. USG1]VVD27884.1 conserved protein of unknown function [Paraburkholderia dioscoreae]